MFLRLRVVELFYALAKPHLLVMIGVLLTQIASASSISAHPHAWIDLRSTVVLNEKGEAVALEQEWLFDDFYTAVATEASGGAKDRRTDWTELAKENLESLRAYDYFTEVRAAGNKVALATVTDYASEVRGGRLWMRFVVPFAEPVNPSAKRLSYSVFDPTYYIEILHLKGNVIAFRGKSSGQCAGQIVAAKPSTEMVLLAQALDKNAKSDDTLGQMFAERVDVSCR